MALLSGRTLAKAQAHAAPRSRRSVVVVRAYIVGDVPPNVAEARAWIAAWRASQKPAAAAPPAPPTPSKEVPANVLEAREWIAAWRKNGARSKVVDGDELIDAWRKNVHSGSLSSMDIEGAAPAAPAAPTAAAAPAAPAPAPVAAAAAVPSVSPDGSLVFSSELLKSTCSETLKKRLEDKVASKK